MNLIASVLHLSRRDIKALRVTDPYSLHRVVYSLFDDVRTEAEKAQSISSGILYADQGGNFQGRRILILSNRPPAAGVPPREEAAAEENPGNRCGQVESKDLPEAFLDHSQYRFQVTINPTRRDSATRKLIPIRGRPEVADWFLKRAEVSWGFAPSAPHLLVSRLEVLQFKEKRSRKVTLAQAHLQGVLRVTNRSLFQQSFAQGIGRGRSFGCGLLQLAPLSKTQ